MKKPATIQKQYLLAREKEMAKFNKKHGVHFLKDHHVDTPFKVHGVYGQFGTLLEINEGSCKVIWENEKYTSQLIARNTVVQ